MENLIPKNWMPPAKMDRIICHWTAGAYEVSDLDKDHYHFIIDGAGKVHRGFLTVADNENTGDGTYAAHTYQLNTRSIGVSCACMAGASYTNPGKFPLTKKQWETLAQVVAELALEYDIPCTPRSILQHGEVTEIYDIDQGGKWDICYLPWDPSLGGPAVGAQFRKMVAAIMAGGGSTNQVKLIVDGIQIGTAEVVDGVTMVPLRKVAEALGCSVAYDKEAHVVTIKKGGTAK